MYDAPFATTAVAGWILTGVVVVLLTARAVRVELRGSRSVGVRVLDAVLALAVVALLASLALVVVTAFR